MISRATHAMGASMKSLLAIFALSAAVGIAAPANADAGSGAPSAAPTGKDSSVHDSVTIDGKAMPYTATAGTITLQSADGTPTCSMFYVAYTADGIVNTTTRPVTFFYNGGPGSSTVWLRMGSFGPKRVLMANAQPTSPAPYSLVDNEYSLLDKTDMVFVDAPGTGFSRLLGDSKPEQFYGVDQDGRAFTQFVQRYITQNSRWNSPKFLFGESYGTTRSAVLVNMLQQGGMDFNGVVILSSALNFGTEFVDGDGLDNAYIGYLPTEAAVAWYHDKLPHKPANLPGFLRQVESFAMNEYADALLKGARLPSSERDDVVRKLHEYTGISETFYRHADLRVEPGEFEKELLRDEYRTTGRLDARYLGIDGKAIGDFPDYDPTSTGSGSAEVSAFNDYVRTSLKYQTDLIYDPLDIGVNQKWDLTHSIDGNQIPIPDVVQDLHDALTQNPHLLLFSANGYYDMATPYFATEYTLNHMALDPSLRSHITYGFYESGHMVYLNVSALAQFKADLARWYDQALSH
jgi:carboxypeptidase C (cathepsin A)